MRRAASIWKFIMNPHNIDMEDISNVFFDSIPRLVNMRYLKSQQITIEHADEKGTISRALHENCGVGVDGRGTALQAWWLEEHWLEGVAEGMYVGVAARHIIPSAS